MDDSWKTFDYIFILSGHIWWQNIDIDDGSC